MTIAAIQTLASIPHWVGWKHEPDEKGKTTKVLKCARVNRNASSTDPQTWSDYETAVAAVEKFGYDGTGWVFTEDVGIIGIDLDKCIDDNGNTEPWAIKIVEAIDSYTEISPSGKGLHILAYGALPKGMGQAAGSRIEMYPKARYFTITENHLPSTPEAITHRGNAVMKLYQAEKERRKGAKVEPPKQAATVTTNGNGRSPYVEAALQSELAELAAATDGHRNSTLNKVAFSLGQFVGAGHLTEAETETMLHNTALAIGLGERETEKTIRSGLSQGIATPRTNWPDLNGNGAAPIVASGNGKPPMVEGEPMPDDDVLPRIQTNARHHRDVSEDAYQALLAANDPPAVFVRSGQLTRIKLDEDKGPIADPMDAEMMRHNTERAASFFTRRTKQDGEIVDTSGTIPMAVVKDIMAYPYWDGLPALTSIATYPTFAPDGTLHSEPGYNPATRLYYHQNGLELGDTEPTDDNIAKAKDLILNHLLVDFPFIDNASRTNAVALLLLPFVRPIIKGATPMHIIDAPTHGTGKSKLASVMVSLATGQSAVITTAPTTEEEWGKTLLSSLLNAPSHILIDNIPNKLESGKLAAALTANDRWSERLLGVMKTVTVPVKNTWIGTGNQTTAHGELARRIVWIRLDSKLEKPWERKSFVHPSLEVWTSEHRGELVTAALTLIRRWLVADRPRSDLAMGSYDEWVKIFGGILETAGFADFLGNAAEMYDQADVTRLPWSSFVDQWYEAYGYSQVGASELFSIASEYDKGDVQGLNLLGEFITGATDRARSTQLGSLLRSSVSKVFGDHRIISAGTRNRAAQYKLEPANRLFE